MDHLLRLNERIDHGHLLQNPHKNVFVCGLHWTIRSSDERTVIVDENSSTPGPTAFSDPSTAVDREALDHLFSVTYEELRRLAATVRRDDSLATLSPTTMVNEAWIKLSRTPAVAQSSPLHFKRIAARAMRQVLVSAARRRHAEKRGGGTGVLLALEEGDDAVAVRDDQLLLLDLALDELARMSPRQAQMVESRFFGGLEVNEIAALLDVSEATILRDWRAARAWLATRLSDA
jgi:RNA polymerase sigma factor (TIGR02999 family)